MSRAQERSEAAKRKADQQASDRKNNKWWKPWNWPWNWPAVATCTIALATIVAVGVGIEQWFTLGGQLDEMQADRRPWVAIDIKVGGITWSPEGASVAREYEVKNT